MNLKKLTIGAYLSAAAAVLGIVGVICTAVSSTLSVDNALSGLGLILMMGIGGVLLCLVSVFSCNTMGNHNLLAAAAGLGAIILFMRTFGDAASQRIMLIAGLFSYNAGNVVGWSIFRVSVVAWVCLILACVLVIVSSFLKTVKE